MHEAALALWRFYRRCPFALFLFLLGAFLGAVQAALRAFAAAPLISGFVVSAMLWIGAAIELRRRGCR